jgi:hypothetical protein
VIQDIASVTTRILVEAMGIEVTTGRPGVVLYGFKVLLAKRAPICPDPREVGPELIRYPESCVDVLELLDLKVSSGILC